VAPIFDYKAVSTDGKNVKGLVESDNQKTARQKLKKQGLMVVEIHEKTAAKPGSSSSGGSGGGGLPFIGNRVGVKDIAMMTRQLASLVKATRSWSRSSIRCSRPRSPRSSRT
jgi:general secretion pathway protein F